MEKEKTTLTNENQIAAMLRDEILKSSETYVQPVKENIALENFEYISTQKQPYISPIMTMTQDEVLDFVESYEVSELAKLSVAELNRIGEVLGIDPKILTE